MDHLVKTLDVSAEERLMFEALLFFQLVSYAEIEACGLFNKDARLVMMTLRAKIAPWGWMIVAVYETGYLLVKESLSLFK